MIIYSDRDIFVGAHVTEDVKEALRIEARKNRKSMSRFVYEAIVQKLRDSGHTNVNLVEESTDRVM